MTDANSWVDSFAPAKINLTLHVTGQREDGYHLLDSLVVFASVGDTVRVRPALTTSLTVTGPMPQGVPEDRTNLVWRAAEWFGTPPVKIELRKNLPPSSGIGGGSSDGAACLRALAELYDRPLPAAETTLALGADLAVCVEPKTTRMAGLGEVLSHAPALPDDMGVVLVNPMKAVSTPAVFKVLHSKTNPPMAVDLPAFTDSRAFADWVMSQRNDLEHPAMQLLPEIRQVLDALHQQDPLAARMSGSGATCFALFTSEHDAKTVCDRLTTQHPNWWVQSGTFL